MDKTTKQNVIQLRLRTNLLTNRACLATQSRRFQSIVASGALATILFLVSILNFAMSSQSETRPSRGIASERSVDNSQIPKWDQSFLKRMATKTERKMASVSSKATEMDQLRFGLLEGKYAFKMEDGKISEILYQDTSAANDRPKYIPSKESFLNDYRPLIKTEFTSASKLNEYVDSGRIIESYQLLGPLSSPVAIAKFTSDQYGRLISFKIER